MNNRWEDAEKALSEWLHNRWQDEEKALTEWMQKYKELHIENKAQAERIEKLEAALAEAKTP